MIFKESGKNPFKNTRTCIKINDYIITPLPLPFEKLETVFLLLIRMYSVKNTILMVGFIIYTWTELNSLF